jgi:hypothetical protein
VRTTDGGVAARGTDVAGLGVAGGADVAGFAAEADDLTVGDGFVVAADLVAADVEALGAAVVAAFAVGEAFALAAGDPTAVVRACVTFGFGLAGVAGVEVGSRRSVWSAMRLA